jgi:DNA-binding MarR family transcriptional regulator
MNEKPQTAMICTAMMRLGTRMATLFDQTFARFEITQAQFRVLLEIYEGGNAEGVAPSVLAKNLLLERATVSVLTQRMQERGLLERTAGENRRSFRLRLTAKGEALLHAVIPHARVLADETLAANTPADLDAALWFLERLETRLRSMTGANGAAPSAPRKDA